MADDNLVEFRDVTFAYPGAKGERVILDRVNLQVPRGKVTALLVVDVLAIRPKPSIAGVSMLKGTFTDSSRPEMLPPEPLTGVVMVPETQSSVSLFPVIESSEFLVRSRTEMQRILDVISQRQITLSVDADQVVQTQIEIDLERRQIAASAVTLPARRQAAASSPEK